MTIYRHRYRMSIAVNEVLILCKQLCCSIPKFYLPKAAGMYRYRSESRHNIKMERTGYPSTSSTRFCWHNSPMIWPTDLRNLPYNRFFRYLGTITTWYLQSHLTCVKHCQSCIGSSPSSAPWELPRRKNLFYFTPER